MVTLLYTCPVTDRVSFTGCSEVSHYHLKVLLRWLVGGNKGRRCLEGSSGLRVGIGTTQEMKHEETRGVGPSLGMRSAKASGGTEGEVGYVGGLVQSGQGRVVTSPDRSYGEGG